MTLDRKLDGAIIVALAKHGTGNHGLARNLALAFVGDRYRAIELDNSLAIELALTRSRNFEFVLDRVSDIALNLALDHDLARAFDLDRYSVLDITYYLKAANLLIDCLNTECYISKDLRQKILDEILTVPE